MTKYPILVLIYYYIIFVTILDPCKFFGCELGAQTQFDKTGRYIVNGSHEGDKLQDILFNFIKKFVLCQECDNPETSLVSLSPLATILATYTWQSGESKSP